MGLPDRKGEDLVREVRSIYPSLPIVIASGRSKDEVRQLLGDASLIAFGHKPYTPAELCGALGTVGVRCHADTKNERRVARRTAAPSASRAAREGRTSEPFQHGERWRFVFIESATRWNRPDLVVEHHRQQLMFDRYG
jgi:DNA-binding response OmpR family regulator